MALAVGVVEQKNIAGSKADRRAVRHGDVELSAQYHHPLPSRCRVILRVPARRQFEEHAGGQRSVDRYAHRGRRRGKIARREGYREITEMRLAGSVSIDFQDLHLQSPTPM